MHAAINANHAMWQYSNKNYTMVYELDYLGLRWEECECNETTTNRKKEKTRAVVSPSYRGRNRIYIVTQHPQQQEKTRFHAESPEIQRLDAYGSGGEGLEKKKHSTAVRGAPRWRCSLCRSVSLSLTLSMARMFLRRGLRSWDCEAYLFHGFFCADGVFRLSVHA